MDKAANARPVNVIRYPATTMPSDIGTSSDAEREALRAFLISHYNEIHDFAIACNMTIERYPHNTDLWSLCFTPPQDGNASITIRPLAGGTFELRTTWHVDNFDTATRSIKTENSPTYHQGSGQLTESLREALRNMLKWRTGEWSSVLKTPPGVQKFSREQWENMQVNWPKVRPSGDAG